MVKQLQLPDCYGMVGASRYSRDKDILMVKYRNGNYTSIYIYLKINLVGDPRNFYYGRSKSRLLRNNILRVLKSATREPVVVVYFL